MAIRDIDAFSFTRGIESVIYEEIDTQTRLPENSLFPPSDEHIERHLDRLFENNSINEQLLKALKPSPSDKTIQTPIKYHQMISSIHDQLSEFAKDPSLAQHSDILQKSNALLNEEKSLFDLLNMYRNLLHKA